MNNITASTQSDTISRSALKKAIEQYQIQWNKNNETDIAQWDCCECILAIIDNAPAVEPQMPREYRQALEVLEYIKEHYILVEKSPRDDPNALIERRQNAKTKGGQPERNCEKCEHYKLKTEGVPGDGLYGCELWDCIYERGQGDE